jgi:hypothetical protein
MKKKPAPKTRDPYAAIQTITIVVPTPLLPLCKLLEVTPEKIITDLVNVIGGRLSVANGLVRQRGTEYFLEQGYGQNVFACEDIRRMLIEVGILAGLSAPFGTNQYSSAHEFTKTRDAFLSIWKNKWEQKKKPISKPTKSQTNVRNHAR